MTTATLPRKIWVGSYGWRDCDPCGRCWGLTGEDCQRQIDEGMRDELERALEEYEEGEEPDNLEDNIVEYGCFPMFTVNVVAELEDPSRRLEFEDDLRVQTGGWVY